MSVALFYIETYQIDMQALLFTLEVLAFGNELTEGLLQI